MTCVGGKTAILGVIFILLSITGGCAGEKKVSTGMPEKWTTLAEKSQGNSPAADLRANNVTEFQSRGSTPAKTLPIDLVTLKMRNADVKSILRALARSTSTSVVVSDSAKGTMTIDFDGVSWDRVFRTVLNATGLVYAWEGNILHVMTVHDMEKSMEIEKVQGKKKAQDLEDKTVEPLSTVIVSIDYAEAKSLKDSLANFISLGKDNKPRGSVQVDEHNNSLVISAIREDIDRMLPLIEKIDRPTPQILIKANIVETSKDVARNLGIQWGGLKSATRSGNNYTLQPGVDSTGVVRPFGVDFPVDTTAMAGGAMNLGFTATSLGGNILEMQLQALQKDGKLNIISSPSIITLDNQKAFTESGERVPFVTNSVSGTGNSQTVTQTVQFIDAVLRLEITPHVIDGTNLKMKVIVRKDEVDTSRAVQGNPFIIKKNTETTLIVKNGETIVISGLTRQRDASTYTGVPLLKDIPLLGWFFRSHSQSNSMEDVLIFVTPHILPLHTALHTAETSTGGTGSPTR